MIRKSFIFLDGINKKTEQNIWAQGIKDWNDFLNVDKIHGISKKRKLFYNQQILYASANLYASKTNYFSDKIPTIETWRLYNFFKDDVVFLDIEASNVDNGFITVIGLFDGINTKIMIKDVNLDYKVLKSELSKYKLIITFNGSSFDLPFIKKRYNFLSDVPHIDLRHLCAKLGYTGGLKKIEKEMGIGRENKIVVRMRGGDPFTLWKMFKASGDDYYLNLLVEYNEEDVINLKKIMDYCYVKMEEKMGCLEKNAFNAVV